MIDVVEILVHWHAGRRMGEVCASLEADPKTVRKYTATAKAAGLVPGGRSPTVRRPFRAPWSSRRRWWMVARFPRCCQVRTARFGPRA